MKLSCIAVLMFIALPVFAFEYHGDGDFTDRGVMSAFDRYRLVLLPHVNLCEKGDYSFSIGKLPAEALFMTIEYIYPKGFSKEDAFQLKKQMQSSVIVRLVLEDLEKNRLFTHMKVSYMNLVMTHQENRLREVFLVW